MFGKITAHHGSTLIEAQIIASELPATMPTTSDGIDNLGDGYTLAPGSTMIVTGTDKQYILGDDGTWEELPAGGGGGDVSGKADKVSGAVSGNLAGLDSSGNLTDSGKKPADFEISGTATGTAISITDSADANVLSVSVKGHSEVVSGEIVSVGDNGLTVTTNSKNLFTGLRVGVSINPTTGEFGEWAVAATTDYIPVEPGYYTVSGLISGLTTLVCWYDDEHQKIDLSTSSDTTRTIYNDGNASYVAISQYQSENIADLVAAAKIQLEKGQTATAYVPNSTTTAAITTGLPLRSLSESIYDVMDNKKVLFNCGILDLGDLSWSTTANANEFRANVALKAPYSGAKSALLCPMYAQGISSIRADKTIWSEYNVTPKDIVVKDTAYTDAATFKTAVTGVKLIYPLETPTETALTTAEKTALAALKTYNSTTHISATDSPEMTVDYLLNTNNGQAVAKVDDKIPTVFDTTVTLYATDWLYHQTTQGILWVEQEVNITDILATDTPIVDVNVTGYGSAAQEQIIQFGRIGSANAFDGAIIFYCYDIDNIPTIDLSVNIKVVRKVVR